MSTSRSPVSDVFDSNDESGDPFVVIAQWRNRDALLHLVEMFGRRNGSAGNQVMVKCRRQHFDNAIVQRSLETFQQTTLFEIGQQCGQRLTAGRLFADAGETRQRGIPYLNHQMDICGENAD